MLHASEKTAGKQIEYSKVVCVAVAIGVAEVLSTRALMEFRQSGASPAAEAALAKAFERNAHVPAYL